MSIIAECNNRLYLNDVSLLRWFSTISVEHAEQLLKLLEEVVKSEAIIDEFEGFEKEIAKIRLTDKKV